MVSLQDQGAKASEGSRPYGLLEELRGDQHVGHGRRRCFVAAAAALSLIVLLEVIAEGRRQALVGDHRVPFAVVLDLIGLPGRLFARPFERRLVGRLPVAARQPE